KVEAENWKLKHYLNYRLENENVIPPWLTVYNDWESSLEIIKKTNNKKIPVSIRSFCEELSNVNTFEGSSIMKSCMEWYDDFHDRYFDLQLAERAQYIERNIYSSQKVSKWLRGRTSEKRRSQNGEATLSKNEVANEQKRRSEQLTEDLMEESIEETNKSILLFDESCENDLVESIDELSLGKEISLPISKKKIDVSKQDNFWQGISEKFVRYQNKIPQTRKIITLGYWGIFDLTQESFHGCTEFSQSEIDKISQDFSDHVHWSPEPAPEYLQKYFESNCDPSKIGNIEDYATFENLHMNIKFAICHMSSVKGAKTEESLKFTTMYPLFNASWIHHWGEVQAIGSKEARNEDANPFVKARIGRKVDMKGVLTRTSNKFEALYGEVAGGLSSIGISLASRKKKYFDKIKLAVLMRDSLNHVLKEWRYLCDDQRKEIIVFGWTLAGLDLSLYALDWAGDGIYRFGRIDHCSFPLNKESSILFEDVFCLLKELERKLSETETLIQKLHSENIRGKRRKTNTENSPVLNLKRTPK
ncbi:9546_t:CDS:2, partial [Funneliformis caledonium]